MFARHLLDDCLIV